MDVVKEEGKTDQVLLLLSPEGEGKKKKDLHICGGGGQIRCGGWARKKDLYRVVQAIHFQGFLPENKEKDKLEY